MPGWGGGEEGEEGEEGEGFQTAATAQVCDPARLPSTRLERLRSGTRARAGSRLLYPPLAHSVPGTATGYLG